MSVSRREFMQSSGAVVVCFSLVGCEQEQTSYDGRIRIYPDGSVELMLGKVELGQGISTALAQIAADELGIAFERIRLVTVDTDFSPDEAYTFSSISIQQSGPRIRAAAAKARGHVQQLSDAEPGDKPTVLGTSIQRVDIPGKVFGDACFVQDLRFDGMVHARIVRPPAERAVIRSMDSKPVEAMPGVLLIVRDGNFVGVVAEREGQARKAATALAALIDWELPLDLPDSDAMYDWLKKAETRTEEVASTGKVAILESDAAHRATYQRPYQAHASISPSAAVALFDDSRLTVWSHAQGMYPLRDAIAHTLELSPDNVRCVHKEASGCYGHNGADDAACDAAALAMKMPGRPGSRDADRGASGPRQAWQNLELAARPLELPACEQAARCG